MARPIAPLSPEPSFPQLSAASPKPSPQLSTRHLGTTRSAPRILSSPYVQQGLKWRAPFLREYIVAFLLTVLCVILLSLTMEALWRTMYRPALPQAYVFSLLGLLGLPACFQYYSYIYDFPSLLLYTTCLLLIAHRRWGWYFFMFALSCLSKETTALLIIVFAAYFIRCAATERRTYWGFIVIQSVIVLAARATLAWVFRDNPGSIVEFHLVDHNLPILASPWSGETLVAWGVLAVLFLQDFPRKPWLLRVAAGMIVPLLVLGLLFGYLDELRDYYEVYVPLAALVGFSVCRLLGCKIETIAPTNAFNVRRIRAAADA